MAAKKKRSSRKRPKKSFRKAASGKNQKKSVFILVIVVAIIIAGAYVFIGTGQDQPSQSGTAFTLIRTSVGNEAVKLPDQTENNSEHDNKAHEHSESAQGHDMQGMDASSMKHGHLTTFGPGEAPHFHSMDFSKFDTVKEISRNPGDVPAPIKYVQPRLVKQTLVAKEVISEIGPGITYHYWTFDGKIPGPMLRVRVGDTVELTLKNDISSSHNHSIDLHAVTGPGGGAVSTQVAAGQSKTVRFKVLNPGTYVYHCATPNVPMHMANGMFGLIVVEPEQGLPQVDKEFYVMQGELYTSGTIGTAGFMEFDPNKMINEDPEYVVFNGRPKGLVDNPLEASVGDRIRIYAGNGGVSLVSSFHVIGEIFDKVYVEASSRAMENIQTTMIPAGGATVVEMDLQVPGNYVLVDHALARLERGAWGLLKVAGNDNPEVYKALN